eukprot:gene1119-1278_t
MSSTTTEEIGIVVGCYEGCDEWTGSALATEINTKTNGALAKQWKLADNKGKLGDTLIIYDILPEVPRLAIVGLGKKPVATTTQYDLLESARRGAGSGAKVLKSKGANKILIDCSIGDVRACAEGANLGIFKFDLKTSAAATKPLPELAPHNAAHQAQWTEGSLLANSQNFARFLADMPANLMTPTIFVEQVQKKFAPLVESGKVEIIVREEAWVREQKMGMFLGVAQGSDQPLKFLEIHYRGAASDVAPVIFVGKGITFDSGGISLKPSANMGLMRGDMEGAATAVSSIFGVASLGLKVNLTTLTPLCENMPSGKATKPGDVLTAANGLTIEVDNTDAEGRLVLGDALHYANSFNPSTVIDIATLTGAIDVALGAHYAGCFAGTDELWAEINAAGSLTGDRMWRMPLLPEYRKQLDSKYADMVNSAGRSGGSCSAAMFLKEFVKVDRWAHLDIAGVMHSTEEGPYLARGMTGKPVRALIEVARTLSQQ